MAERQLGVHVDDALLRPPLSRTCHEDHARTSAGADEAVLGVRRAVHEVPRLERPLLALDQEQALAREDEKVLLVRLTVIPPARLPGLEYRQGEADVGERCVVALDDESGSESL